MKELNLYQIYVNTRGPHAYTKSGSGVWFIAETSEKNAKKALQRYFNLHNLIGSTDDVAKSPQDLDVDLLPRGTCMRREEYTNLKKAKKLSLKDKYQFSPKKSEKGLELHKINRKAKEYRDIVVPGAERFTPNMSIKDCGPLKNIDGVTLEGKSLSGNLESSNPEDYDLEQR